MTNAETNLSLSPPQLSIQNGTEHEDLECCLIDRLSETTLIQPLEHSLPYFTLPADHNKLITYNRYKITMKLRFREVQSYLCK